MNIKAIWQASFPNSREQTCKGCISVTTLKKRRQYSYPVASQGVNLAREDCISSHCDCHILDLAKQQMQVVTKHHSPILEIL